MPWSLWGGPEEKEFVFIRKPVAVVSFLKHTMCDLKHNGRNISKRLASLGTGNLVSLGENTTYVHGSSLYVLRHWGPLTKNTDLQQRQLFEDLFTAFFFPLLSRVFETSVFFFSFSLSTYMALTIGT